MCYGNLDPKHMMRDIEARVKPLSYVQDTTKQAAPAPQFGLLAQVRDAVRALLRKGPKHV